MMLNHLVQPMMVMLDGGHFTVTDANSIYISKHFHLLFSISSKISPIILQQYQSTYYLKNYANIICQGL